MNHQVMITVDGYTWVATATTHHNGKEREVSAIACIDVPLRVLGALSDHLIDVHDVLELVRNYLNDTATVKQEATCGPIEITWYPLNGEALRNDLTGRTFEVKLVDKRGGVHLFDIGAANSWEALDVCGATLDGGPRSSVVVPMSY